MMEGFENKDNEQGKVRSEIFSKAVRAGKRTYFFDVKATRRNDYYVTVTESKKKFNPDGSFYYEKHKLFLYKEDFEKFAEGLKDVVDYIGENQPELIAGEISSDNIAEKTESSFVDVDFDDLDENNA